MTWTGITYGVDGGGGPVVVPCGTNSTFGASALASACADLPAAATLIAKGAVTNALAAEGVCGGCNWGGNCAKSVTHDAAIICSEPLFVPGTGWCVGCNYYGNITVYCGPCVHQ